MPDTAGTLEDLIISLRADFSNALEQFKELKVSLEETKGGSISAGESILEMAKSFGELALGGLAAAGIATGIEEIAKSSLEAYSHVQDLTTSFTLMMGSADKASESVEQLKDMAMQLAIPMEGLESTAQRLLPSFGSFEKLVPVLKAAADAAAVTGRDFDTVASALQRIEITGAVQGRQLMQLGLSWQQLADSMGISVEEAQKKMAKGGQDAEKDVADVVAAIEYNFGGGAAAMAQNLSGQWTKFKNEVEEGFEALGKASSGFFSSLLSGLTFIIEAFRGNPEIDKMLEKIEQMDPAFQRAKQAAGAYSVALIDLDTSAVHVGSSTYQWSQATKDTIDGLEVATEKVNGLAVDLKEAEAMMRSGALSTQQYQAVLAAYNKAVEDLNNMLDIHILKADEVEKLEMKVFEAQQKGISAWEKGTAGIQSLNATITSYIPLANQMLGLSDSLAAAQDRYARSAQGAATATTDMRNPIQQMISDMEKFKLDTDETIEDLIQSFLRLATEGSFSASQLSSMFQQFRSELTKTNDPLILNQLLVVMQQLITMMQEAGADATTLVDLENQLAHAVQDVGNKTGETTEEFVQCSDEIWNLRNRGHDALGQINNDIVNGLSRSITDVIFQTGNLTQAFERMGQRIMDIILNTLIADAFKPLLRTIDDSINSLFKFFNVAGSAAGSVGGAVSSGAGGAASVMGTGSAIVGGAVSAAMGIVGAVGAVGSMITGIVGDIEQAHTNNILFRIDMSTVRTANATEISANMLREVANSLSAMQQFNFGTLHLDLVGIMSKLDGLIGAVTRGGGGQGALSIGQLYVNGSPTAAVQPIAEALSTTMKRFVPQTAVVY